MSAWALSGRPLRARLDMGHQRTSADDMEWAGSLSGWPLTNGGRTEGCQRTSAEDMWEPGCQRTTDERQLMCNRNTRSAHMVC